METEAIVRDVLNQQVAAQIYAVSLMVIDVDSDAERRYLQELARQLGLGLDDLHDQCFGRIEIMWAIKRDQPGLRHCVRGEAGSGIGTDPLHRFGDRRRCWRSVRGRASAYVTVAAAKAVDLKSDAVPKGALVGGGLGLLSAQGKSSGKKARNTIVGAVAGGAIGKAGQGSTSGMLYTVSLGAGGQVEVVDDQRELRPGDCVAVEKVGEPANVRRVSASYCDQANRAAVGAVQNEARKDGEQCVAAKQQLVDATTKDELDLAERQISLLCND